MTGLLTALLLAQGLQPQGYVGWTNWNQFGDSTAKVVVEAPLASTGPLLPEDSGTVSHVYWDGSALQDTVGNSWTQNGTVPQVAANVSPFVPGKAGAGPYSAANNYQGSTSLMEWAGDWSVTVVFKPTSFATQQVLLNKRTGAGTAGWQITVAATTGLAVCTLYDGATKARTTTNAAVLNAINVLTCGRSGGTLSAYLNTTAPLTAAVGAMTAAPSEPVAIGKYGASVGDAVVIYEILASTTAYSDALHLARYQRVFGMLTQQGQAISVTRATDQTYTANGLVWSTPNDTLSTGTDGAEVWKASAPGLVKQSASCLAGAVNGPEWTLSGAPTCVADQATAPNGDGMDEWTSTVNSQLISQAGSTASSTTFVGSVWMQKTATGTASIILGPATPASGCACGTSDGSACTAVVTLTNYCKGTFTAVGTTPIRGWVSGTWAASTAPAFGMAPGEYNVSTGTTRFGMAQVEPGLYPTPYTTATRNAGVVTTPLPDLGNKWCVSVTAKTSAAWNARTAGYIWSNFAGSTVNAMNAYISSATVSTNVYDSAGVVKTIGWNHTYGATTTPHRVTVCNNQGAVSLCSDGVQVGVTTGAGTAIQSATLTPLALGAQAGGTQFDGAFSNLKICKGATKCGDCR